VGILGSWLGLLETWKYGLMVPVVRELFLDIDLAFLVGEMEIDLKENG